MGKIFDSFAILDQHHERSQISLALGNPSLFGVASSQDRQKARDAIEAALGVKIFTMFSFYDDKLAEKEIEDALSGGVDLFPGHYSGTTLDVRNLGLTGNLVVADIHKSTITTILMGGNDFTGLIATDCPNLATITGMDGDSGNNHNMHDITINGSGLTTFAPFANAASPIINLDMRDNLSLTELHINDGGNADLLETVDVTGCTSLSQLTIGSEATHLQSIDGLADLSALTIFDLIVNHTFQDVGLTTPLAALDLSALTSVTRISLEGPFAFTSVALPQTATLLTLIVVNTNLAGTLDLRNMTGMTHLTAHGNADITAVKMQGLSHLVAVTEEDPITVLDLSASTASLAALVITSTSIAAFEISPFTLLQIFSAGALGWSAAQVNHVLQVLDGAGLHNGTAYLLGNTAPSGAGITAKNNLTGKGWTVQTD